MNKKEKRLKMNIRGFIVSHIYNYYADRVAKRHGVKNHSIIHHNSKHVEVVVDGPQDSLWQVINSNKKGPAFCNVEEITFQFVEV